MTPSPPGRPRPGFRPQNHRRRFNGHFRKHIFFLQKQRDAECSETETYEFLKNYVKLFIWLICLYALDHSESMD